MPNSGTHQSETEQALGGRGEIRTHERLSTLPVFKTGALNHSATLPALEILMFLGLCKQLLASDF